MTILQGLLVDLVPFTREYRDEKMHAWWNNETRAWAMMGDAQPTTRAQIRRIQEERAGGRERGYTGVHFMLRAKDGNAIGSIGLNWVDEWSRVGYVGAWIGEEAYLGGGHGSDALLLITEYAFDWLDLRRLCLGTMDINERARRNVEKCGYKLEARTRSVSLFNGQWVTGLEYGLLREEWPGREALVEALGLREKAAQRYGKAE